VTRRRAIGAAVALLAGAGRGAAEAAAVRLADETKPGDHLGYEITLTAAGKIKVDREGGAGSTLPLEAAVRHRFAERVERLPAGAAGRAVRHYAEAQAESAVSVDRSRRTLAADRRLVVVQRTAEGTVHYSPDGPLTREELDLVAEHFDTLCIPGLLPDREVAVGDTWPVRDDVAQAACQFDGLIKHALVGKLVGVKDGKAEFAIDGTAEGIEHGAKVKLEATARGTFDLAAKRVVALNWEQTDDRDQGPVSPAAEVKATITITRTPLAAEPAELSAAARAKVPADGAVPDLLTHLRYAHPKGLYEMVYPRDWHVVVGTDAHLILRLVSRGEFVAQATVSPWKRAEGDRAAVVKEFVEATAKQPGWELERALENGPAATGPGRQLYRLAAAGKQDGQGVIQAFHLLTAADGRQVVVTCLARREVADKVGTRDVALANAVEFPAAK
jgi:hypothetical protein